MILILVLKDGSACQQTMMIEKGRDEEKEKETDIEREIESYKCQM